MEKQNNHIDRRGFLKIVGISAATVSYTHLRAHET